MRGSEHERGAEDPDPRDSFAYEFVSIMGPAVFLVVVLFVTIHLLTW